MQNFDIYVFALFKFTDINRINSEARAYRLNGIAVYDKLAVFLILIGMNICGIAIKIHRSACRCGYGEFFGIAL